MKQIEFAPCTEISECYKQLLEESRRNGGEPVCGLFNSTMMYSTESLDNFYHRHFHKSQKEFEKELELERAYREQKQIEHIQNTPRLIIEYRQKARGIITESRLPAWDNIVPTRVSGIYEGYDLQCALDLITILNEDKPILERIDKCREKFAEQAHSGCSGTVVLGLTSAFHKDGMHLMLALI